MSEDYDSNGQSADWMKNEDLQKFIRQAHTDMHVGLKNGVPERDVAWAIFDFLNRLDNQLRPSKMIRMPDGSFKEEKMSRSLS
jgi:hypothetical protein